MAERAAGRDRQNGQGSTTELGRVPAAKAAPSHGTARHGQVSAADEVVVHLWRFFRRAVWSNALGTLSLACLTAVPWFRLRQATTDHPLRWSAGASLLSLLGIGFAAGARLPERVRGMVPKTISWQRTHALAQTRKGRR
jgi:hypothetical protein